MVASLQYFVGVVDTVAESASAAYEGREES